MDHGYFREEALAAHQTRHEGAIVLRQPVPMRVAACASVAIGILLATYVGVAQYTRKVHVAGQIAPAAGAIHAVALQGGRIVHLHVRDGDQVRQGQPLFDLSAKRSSNGRGIDSRIDASIGERRRAFEQELAVQAGQLRERIANLQSRGRLNQDNIARLDDEIASQRARWRRARDMLARYKALRKKGFVAEPRVASVEHDVGDQLAKLRALERNQRSTRADLLQIEDDITQLRSQGELYAAQTARNLATLAQEEAEQQGRAAQCRDAD